MTYNIAAPFVFFNTQKRAQKGPKICSNLEYYD